MGAAVKKVDTRGEGAEKTRRAILAAAEEMFARGGMAGARTEAIAAAAGVNKAMLYYYFKDKESLYQAVVEEHFAAFNERALEVLHSAGSAREVLLRYVDLHFEFIAGRQRYAALYQQLMMAGGKPLERLVKRYFVPRAQALDALLERGMNEGEFRRADRTHLAVSITALIVFYFSAAKVLRVLRSGAGGDAYSPENLKRRKEEVMAFIRHGVFADGRNAGGAS